MATDADRFGRRLGKRFVRRIDRMQINDFATDIVAEEISVYLISAIRKDWPQFPDALRALERECERQPLFVSLPLQPESVIPAPIVSTNPAVAMFLYGLRTARFRRPNEVLRSFANKAVDFVEECLSVQRSLKDRHDVRKAIRDSREVIVSELCERLTPSAQRVHRPRKKKPLLSVADSLNVRITALP